MADTSNSSKLQNALLNTLRTNKASTTIILTNGFQMHGTVESFDAYSIVLVEANGQQNLIYKHAISTVKPSRHVDLPTVCPAGKN